MEDPYKEKCISCKIGFLLSDPNCFVFDDGWCICKTCWLSIVNHVSWGANVQKKIVFDYTKVSIPHKLKWEIWERDDFTCKKCGSKDNLSIDHIHPESFGGTLETKNLQTL